MNNQPLSILFKNLKGIPRYYPYASSIEKVYFENCSSRAINGVLNYKKPPNLKSVAFCYNNVQNIDIEKQILSKGITVSPYNDITSYKQIKITECTWLLLK